MAIFYRMCWDRKYGLLGWAIGILFLMMLLGWYYPILAKEKEAMEALFASFPDSVLALFGAGDGINLMSGSGFLTIEAFGLMLPIFFSIFAMNIGAQAIAGEETDGTLEILATMPVSRGRIYLEKFLALHFLIVVLGICLWLSVLAASKLGNMEIASAPIAGSSLMVGLLGLFFGVLTFVIGAVTGRRGRTVTIATAIIVITYALNALAQMIESLEFLRWLSPFSYYNQGMSLDEVLQVGDALPLFLWIILVGAIGFLIFRQRDLQ